MDLIISFAFSKQKIDEVVTLKQVANGENLVVTAEKIQQNV